MVDGGYTPAEISEFTLADADLFLELPPIRSMVAAYLGVKTPTRLKAANSSPANTSIEYLKSTFPGGVMRG